MHKYQGRIPVIHLKDYRPTEQGPFTVELGEGIVPLREIAGAAAVIGTKWLIVEQDECLGDPLESVRKSYASDSRKPITEIHERTFMVYQHKNV